MSDPTNTARLRRSFQAEGNRRLARLRSLTHQMLVEHDLMEARNDPLAQFLPHPGHRLEAFAQWFERTAEEQLLGTRWWEKFLQRAYQSGVVAGGELVGRPPPGPAPVPAVYRELAAREFAGIAATLVQQVTRQAAGAAIGRRKPLPMYQQVLPVLHKVGSTRMKANANFLAVKLHNAGRLAHFRAVGITRVGIEAERPEPRQRSRFLKHDHLLHDQDTPEERRLAAALKAANELLKRQRKERAEEEAQREEELAAYNKALEVEIAAQMAGAPVAPHATMEELQAALTRKEGSIEEQLAAIKAETAAREVEAKAAWEEVLAARREARAAAYPRRIEPARTAEMAAKPLAIEKRAAEYAAFPSRPPPELVTSVTVGTPGEEWVNVLTAGDDLVCIECEDISASGPYQLDEAETLIPAHPNCRCSFIPADDMRFELNRELASANEEEAGGEEE